MNIDGSIALTKINEIINDLIAALPNIAIGVIIFLLFYLAVKWAKGLVERLTDRSGLAPNASLLVGPLSRWLVIFLGLLVTLSVVIPPAVEQ